MWVRKYPIADAKLGYCFTTGAATQGYDPGYGLFCLALKSPSPLRALVRILQDSCLLRLGLLWQRCLSQRDAT